MQHALAARDAEAAETAFVVLNVTRELESLFEPRSYAEQITDKRIVTTAIFTALSNDMLSIAVKLIKSVEGDCIDWKILIERVILVCHSLPMVDLLRRGYVKQFGAWGKSIRVAFYQTWGSLLAQATKAALAYAVRENDSHAFRICVRIAEQNPALKILPKEFGHVPDSISADILWLMIAPRLPPKGEPGRCVVGGPFGRTSDFIPALVEVAFADPPRCHVAKAMARSLLARIEQHWPPVYR